MANAVDADRVFALFSRERDFATADNGQLYTSVDPLRETYRALYAQYRSQEITIDTSRVTVLTPDAAVMTMNGTSVPVARTGTSLPPVRLAWTILWVREPTGWKARQLHQSFVR